MFDIFESVNQADQAHKFYIRNGLSEGYGNTILAELCEVTECARAEPLIW